MSLLRLFRLGIRVAAWATPHVKKWHHERNMNHEEAKRHLDARNWTEAEKHLMLALGERRRSAKGRHELLVGLARAQRGQRKFLESEENLRQAAVAGKDHSMYVRSSRLIDWSWIKQVRRRQKTIEEIVRRESAQHKPDHARLAQCSRKLGWCFVISDRRAEWRCGSRAGRQTSESLSARSHRDGQWPGRAGALIGKGDGAEAQHCLRARVRRGESARFARSDQDSIT
jgi:hypothetical protein